MFREWAWALRFPPFGFGFHDKWEVWDGRASSVEASEAGLALVGRLWCDVDEGDDMLVKGLLAGKGADGTGPLAGVDRVGGVLGVSSSQLAGSSPWIVKSVLSGGLICPNSSATGGLVWLWAAGWQVLVVLEWRCICRRARVLPRRLGSQSELRCGRGSLPYGTADSWKLCP